MESSVHEHPNRSPPSRATRYEKLLQQEVLACEDPICCCEAEPRWLRFDRDDPTRASEWESAERDSADEL